MVSRYNLGWLLDYEYWMNIELIGRIDTSDACWTMYSREGFATKSHLSKISYPTNHSHNCMVIPSLEEKDCVCTHTAQLQGNSPNISMCLVSPGVVHWSGPGTMEYWLCFAVCKHYKIGCYLCWGTPGMVMFSWGLAGDWKMHHGAVSVPRKGAPFASWYIPTRGTFNNSLFRVLLL